MNNPSKILSNNLPISIQNEMRQSIIDTLNDWPESNIIDICSEWAERNRMMSGGLTSKPGPFRFDPYTPYLREILNCMSDSSPVLECYVIKPTQVGFTVGVTENHIGYCIEYGIGPVTYVGGDATMAEQQMSIRIDDMIAESGLSAKIRPNVIKKKGKATGDTVDTKMYAGTFMKAVGPNSESKAATFPMKILHLDEMDKYPVQLAANGVLLGDIVEKFRRRQDSYGPLKKTLGGSTPKGKSISRIEPLVEDGDKRYYNITCPECKIQHPLTWPQLKWEKNEKGEPDIIFENINGADIITKDPTYHECPGCGYHLKYKDKYDVLKEKGHGGTAEWIPTKKPSRPFVQSYVLNGLYGFRTWIDIVLQFLDVKDDPLKLPDFINDVLGETWQENRTKPDEHELLLIAQEFEQWPRGHIKKEVIFLTLTCDVQADRLEFSLCGWGHNKQAYIIQYWVEEGETHVLEDQCWKNLYEAITAKYEREDGQELFVQVAFIDSQYESLTVDAFCDQFNYDPDNIAGVFPIQAKETQDKLVKEFKSNIKTPVVGLHDQKFKHALYSMLRKRPNGPGQFPGHYFHFSMDYGPEFYNQLTSEEIITTVVKGAVKNTKILNSKQRRNEVFDNCKYHLATYEFMIDKYFKILNEDRKLHKMPELQQSASIFMERMESLLYE